MAYYTLSSSGWVYLAQEVRPGISNGPVKIGVAADPEERVRTLSTAGPFPVRLLSVCQGNHSRENYFHKLYAHARLNGEWFQLSLTEITALQKLFSTVGVKE